jgi:hypothetical protein
MSRAKTPTPRLVAKVAPPDLVKAMNSKTLFRPWFDGESWNGWKAVLKAMDALPMTADEVAFFKSVAGGRNLPTRPVREFYAACARRTGKDSAASAIAAHAGAFFNQQSRLRPGERASILCLACDQAQATIILNYIKSYFADIPMLRSMVVRETKTGVELSNGVDILVVTNDFRSIRGRAILLVILDECAFYRSENSASPDIEVYNAIRPALASLPGSRIIGISSPYRKAGLLWNKYRQHFGQDGDDVLVIQSDVRTLNPTISEEYVSKALEEDPAAAAAEVLGQFRDDVGGYVSLELIEAAVDRGVVVRQPRRGVTYHAGLDPSGGARDSFAAAVSSRDENGAIVLDCLLEIRAPFNPSSATEQIAAMLKAYGITTATSDRYAAEWPVDAFRKCGIALRASDRDRSAIYADALPLFTSGRARLLDNPRLVNQFVSLERKTTSIGRDKIDHGPGGRDDLCNAAALALVLAAKTEVTPVIARPIIVNRHGEITAATNSSSKVPAHYLKQPAEPWRAFVDAGDWGPVSTTGRRSWGPI